MNFNAFMAELRKKELPQVFLLAGEEDYYIDRARERIYARLFPDGADKSGITQLRPEDDADAWLTALRSSSMFSPVNVVVAPGTLLREKKGSEEGKGGKDKSVDRLAEEIANLLPTTYLIVQMKEKPDKRKKLTKAILKAGIALEADPVRAWNIDDWLLGKLQSIGKTMDVGARAYFATAVSMMKEISLSYLDQQFDKLALFSSDRKITKAEIESIFSHIPEVSIFALSDAISERDAKKALTLLARAINDGVYFTILLAVLTRHVRQLWQIQLLEKQGIRGKALAKPLNLNPYIAERHGRAAQRFSESVLKQAYLELVDADYKLKTGKGGNELLEHAVIVLCGK